jgi:hypothetical protein
MPGCRLRSTRAFVLVAGFVGFVDCSRNLIVAGDVESARPLELSSVFEREVSAGTRWGESFALDAGDTIRVSVSIPTPSAFPPNGRLRVSWSNGEARLGVSKILHAFDADVHFVHRAPIAGVWSIRIEPVEDEEAPRARFASDEGAAPIAASHPARTPWPPELRLPTRIQLRRLDLSRPTPDLALEVEPNDTPALAQEIDFGSGDEERSIVIVGGQDEVDYFLNTDFGHGERADWIRIRHSAPRPKLLTLQLSLIDPIVAGSLRFFREAVSVEPAATAGDSGADANGDPSSTSIDLEIRPIDGGSRLASRAPDGRRVIVEPHLEGKDPNERPHQQDDLHRTFITRMLAPGRSYFVRVEANQPGYELELRLVDPAPYDDANRAIAHGMYYHLAEVGAWMIHKPRGNAFYERARTGTNLFGETCMSCHANSGVWGVAEASGNGHPIPPGTAMAWRRLVREMYECARPTNTIEDAAINTSTSPADYGDGLAGTRVAGRNIAIAERVRRPSALHAHQIVRVANYIVRTPDPKAINAAGKGANYGPIVPHEFAAEVLRRVWDDTGDPKYLRALEERIESAFDPENDKRNNAVTDDLGHRLELAGRVWPIDYAESVEAILRDPRYSRGDEPAELIERARTLDERVRSGMLGDEARLRELQLEDGSWPFARDGSGKVGHPAPTAVALAGLHAIGRRTDDPAVTRGIAFLLSTQEPQGLWRGGETGFVTTAYVLRALGLWQSRPVRELPRRTYIAVEGESPLETLARARRIALSEGLDVADLALEFLEHDDPHVRAHGLVAIGAARATRHVSEVLSATDDRVKHVREAAHWALREILTEDVGWDEIFAAFEDGDDSTRATVVRALVVELDLIGTKSRVDHDRLLGVLERAMNDRHPTVRATALHAARWWWVWNPPLRPRIGAGWISTLQRIEPHALGEQMLRYSTRALLQSNQYAGDTPFVGLTDFELALARLRNSVVGPGRDLIDRRLLAVAATYYGKEGTNNVHQLRFGTKSALTPTLGRAALDVLDTTTALEAGDPWRRIPLEAAATVRDERLQARILRRVEDPNQELDESFVLAVRALAAVDGLELDATEERGRIHSRRIRELIQHGEHDGAERLSAFISRVRWRVAPATSDGESSSPEDVLHYARALLEPLSDSSSSAEQDWTYANAVGRVLESNPTLRRNEIFALIPGENASGVLRHAFLRAIPWMIGHSAESSTRDFSAEGAIEFSPSSVREVSAGRVDDVVELEGIASGSRAISWREHRPGAKLRLRFPVESEGRREIRVAFLLDPDGATIRAAIEGQSESTVLDLYKSFPAATSPIVLARGDFARGEQELIIENIGANPAARAETWTIGIDYVTVSEIASGDDAIGRDERGRRVLDPLAGAKSRLIGALAAALAPDAPMESRALALNVAGNPSVRGNPMVRQILAELARVTTDGKTRETLTSILDGDEKRFIEELRAALANERSEGLTPPFAALVAEDEVVTAVREFRDGPWVELHRVRAEDERSCMSCHGVPGRVPPLPIEPAEPNGAITAAKLLENYRKLQALVDPSRPERSRLLLKPLNLQDADEGAHQGGTRFTSTDDPGFAVLRAWVDAEASRRSKDRAP